MFAYVVEIVFVLEDLLGLTFALDAVHVAAWSTSMSRLSEIDLAYSNHSRPNGLIGEAAIKLNRPLCGCPERAVFHMRIPLVL